MVQQFAGAICHTTREKTLTIRAILHRQHQRTQTFVECVTIFTSVRDSSELKGGDDFQPRLVAGNPTKRGNYSLPPPISPMGS